jgi:hypothetical protein
MKYLAAVYRRINGQTMRCSIQILQADNIFNIKRQAEARKGNKP